MSTNYREVRRKAAVGERIRVVNPIMAVGYREGDEGTVEHTLSDGAVRVRFRSVGRVVIKSEYVVLEPSVFPQDFVNFVLENADGIRKLIDEIEKEAA